MSDSTGKIAHRTIELLDAFESGRTAALVTADIQALQMWQGLTDRLERSPFESCLSKAHTSAYFDGLNADIADKYLSSDPIDSWDITLTAESNDFSRFQSDWAPHQGYSFFDYADFEGIQLEDEFVENQQVRQAAQSRGRRSLFRKPPSGASLRRRAQRKQIIAAQHPEWAPTQVEAAVEAAEYDEQVAYRQSYPKTMGRTGSTLLTPSQRRMASVRTSSNELTRTASNMAQRKLQFGSKIQGIHGQTPAGLGAIDASYADAAATLKAPSPTFTTSALASAMAIANSAFGPSTYSEADSASRAGVFSVAKATQNLSLANLDPSADPGYQRVLYDAADMQWLSIEEAPPSVIDAAMTEKVSLGQAVQAGNVKSKVPGPGRTAPMFTSVAGQAGRLTATAPELFAANHFATQEQAIQDNLPTTIAGEARYFESGGMDPVVYLNLDERSQSGSPLKQRAGQIVPNTAQMSPQIRAGLNAVSMPLSSASQLQRRMSSGSTKGGFDAARTPSMNISPLTDRILPPASAAAMFASGHLPDVFLSRLASPTMTVRRDDSLVSKPMLSGPEIEGQPAFYQFSYDADTVFLRPESDWSHSATQLAGSHVEMRDGKLIRSAPATRAAQQAAQTQAGGPTLITPTLITPSLITPSLGTPSLGTPSLGTPSLKGLISTTARADRIHSQTNSLQSQLLLAKTRAQEFAMLPPSVQKILGRQADSLVEMTTAGMSKNGLLVRLANVLDTESPGTRSAVIHKLAQMGIDTPQLLQVLDDHPAGTSDTTVARTSTSIRQLAKQLTGRGSAAIEVSDSGKDSYWGDYGPARVAYQSATQLLRALSGDTLDREPQTQTNRAVWDAENGELLSVIGEFEDATDSMVDRTLGRLKGTTEITARASDRITGTDEMPLAAHADAQSSDSRSISTSPLFGAMGLGTQGSASIGAAHVEQMLQSMPGNRNIASFVGGGFDFTYMVFDRVNGALAGLDVGVMRAMQQAADSGATSRHGMEQDMRPGLDDWPSEAFEFLASGDSRPSNETSAREQQVVRLERRVDAAQDAFVRLREARDAGEAPQHFDSVDWSLVSTGTSHAEAPSADIGQLGATMVRQQTIAPAEMSYVAPTIKAVAQQAQLSARDEAPPSATETAPGGGDDSGASETAAGEKKINYNDLATRIASRLQRRFSRERDRHGRG